MKKIKPFNLFEAKLEDFTFDDIYTKDYFEDYLMNQDIIRDYYGVFEEDHPNISFKSEEFKIWLLKLFKEEYNRFLDEFLSKTEYLYGSFEIYRVITVDNNWIEHLKTQGKHLGIFWSWDEDTAEAHQGDRNKPNEAHITCEIKDTDIDWIETLRLNTHPYNNEEKEIRLFKGTPLKITKLLINNILIEDNIIYSKTFYA